MRKLAIVGIGGVAIAALIVAILILIPVVFGSPMQPFAPVPG